MGKLFPSLRPFLDQVNEAALMAREEGFVLTPEIARRNLDGLSQFVNSVPEIDYSQKNKICSQGNDIPIMVYSPDPQQQLPVFVYFHGGGHMSGSTRLYDPMCRKIALSGNCVVISVEYRLTPEFPFPAGLDDCHQAVLNYQQVLDEVCYSSEVILGGDSAGGAITSSLTMRSAHDQALKFDKQVLIYPSVDYTMSSESILSNGTGYLLESERIAWYFNHYFLRGEERSEQSPLFAALPAKLPDTLLITAEFDPLRDEGIAYGKRLKQAGGRVVHVDFEGMIHAFMNIEDLLVDPCRQLYQSIGDFIHRSY